MNLGHVSVLIVEDVVAMRTRIKDICREIGFASITCVSNGQEAKVAMDVDDYQLILADWYTEPVSGFELLKLIRADQNRKNCAFVMVTAENTRDKVIEAIKSGVDDYLVKPLTAAQLQSKVVSALVKRGVLR